MFSSFNNVDVKHVTMRVFVLVCVYVIPRNQLDKQKVFSYSGVSPSCPERSQNYCYLGIKVKHTQCIQDANVFTVFFQESKALKYSLVRTHLCREENNFYLQ